MARHLGSPSSSPFSDRPRKRLRWLRRVAWIALLGSMAVEGFTYVQQQRAARSLISDADQITASTRGSDPKRVFSRHSGDAEWLALKADLPLAKALSTTSVRRGPFRHSRHELNDLAATAGVRALGAPSKDAHIRAARLYAASGEGLASARHWQFASRLAPSDKVLAQRADRALTLSIAHRAKPATRAAGAGALALIALFGFAGSLAGKRRRARHRYVDRVRGSLRMVVDGDSSNPAPEIDPSSESLLVDVLLRGRYGLAPKCIKRRGPTMQVTCSHPGASKSLRLRPIHNVRGDAVRVEVTADTLKQLKAEPGTWRMFVQLDDRCIATAPLEVRAPTKRGFFAMAHPFGKRAQSAT